VSGCDTTFSLCHAYQRDGRDALAREHAHSEVCSRSVEGQTSPLVSLPVRASPPPSKIASLPDSPPLSDVREPALPFLCQRCPSSQLAVELLVTGDQPGQLSHRRAGEALNVQSADPADWVLRDLSAVELAGLEPAASSMRRMRSPN
jgi:hypothetical protein